MSMERQTNSLLWPVAHFGGDPLDAIPTIQHQGKPRGRAAGFVVELSEVRSARLKTARKEHAEGTVLASVVLGFSLRTETYT